MSCIRSNLKTWERVIFRVSVNKPALDLGGLGGGDAPLPVKCAEPALGSGVAESGRGPCVLDTLCEKIELRDDGEALSLNTAHGV